MIFNINFDVSQRRIVGRCKSSEIFSRKLGRPIGTKQVTCEVQTNLLDDSLSEEEYGVGFKKGNTELRDKVQGALEEMAADGTLAKISDEWFGEDVTTIGK